MSVLRFIICAAATWPFLIPAVSAAADAPLATAAELNDSDAIRVLLEKKADVNAAQVDGMTALHWATVWPPAQTACGIDRPRDRN